MHGHVMQRRLLYRCIPPSLNSIFPPSFQQAHHFSLILSLIISSLFFDMADWGPVIVAVVLFVLLTPGLLFQIPGKSRVVEFGNMQTSGASIVVHAIVFSGLITIFLVAIGVHIYAAK
ncbi:uncharacterized protein LOC133675116 [Populus nigra]|uniref:uncharacterized protein LOC133675116 n=1 Tax=Populus nigra TaxID=3691 RepID=UPI002B26DDEF|nr:uncharacterized protein LOC133675116 [Populus nigra]